MAHTPGPWEIKESTGWDEAWCDWHDVGPISLMGPKANDNSRLISAAPELLDALKYVRRFLRPEDHDVAYVDYVIDKATGHPAAAEKAEGR